MKKVKRLLAALLCLWMAVTLLPTAAFATEATEVRVGDVALNSATPYLVNGVASSTGTLGSGGCTAFFANGKLTLQNAALTDSGKTVPGYIYCSSGDLTIKLIGTNTVNCSALATTRGIWVMDNSLRIEGDGSLVVTLNDSQLQYARYGIQVTNGNLTVVGGTVEAFTGNAGTTDKASYGIFVENGNISVSGNAKVTGSSGDGFKSCGIYGTGGITISGGTITAKTTGVSGAKSAFSPAPTLTGYTGGYQWNTNESSPTWTQGAITAFANTGNPMYVQIKPANPTVTNPTQDKTVTVTEGKTATLSVTAQNAAGYLWHVNHNDGNGFVAISGATGASYTTNAVTMANNGFQYYCVVSGAAGTTPVTSLTFTLTVNAPATYAITYDANGGGGTMAGGTATEGVAYTLPACAFTAPAGQRFKEWAVGSPSGTKVNAGSTHTFTAATTVYAIWEPIPTYTYNTPSAITQNGVTATVTYSPASPQAANTGVNATVTLTGTASAAGTHTVSLGSTTAGLTGTAQNITVTAGQTAFTVPNAYSFTVPAQNVDDLTLAHTFTAAPHVHSWSGTWSKDATHHWHECSCGEKKDIAAHSFDGGKVTTAPTETKNGVKTYTCTVCGFAKTESIQKLPSTEIPKTGDSGNIPLWIAILLASGGAAVTFGIFGKKRRCKTK